VTRTGARRRTEDGVAVVVVLGLVGLLLTVALISGGLVAMVATHRQVQAAADLAALAGAGAARSGADPCGEAQRIARANQAELKECLVDGPVIAVVVNAIARFGPGSWAVDARARAGPGERVG